MGLIDKIIKPKWKSNDPKERIEAVRKLDDQNALYDVALNDSDAEICLEAVNRIRNDSILEDITPSLGF